MAVYVDDMRARFGRMVMCHMIADTDEELHAMAARIGVARKWHQDPRTMRKVSHSHYDIALSKRAAAIAAGAIPITAKQAAMMTALKRQGEPMGDPATARQRYQDMRVRLTGAAASYWGGARGGSMDDQGPKAKLPEPKLFDRYG